MERALYDDMYTLNHLSNHPFLGYRIKINQSINIQINPTKYHSKSSNTQMHPIPMFNLGIETCQSPLHIQHYLTHVNLFYASSISVSSKGDK